MKNVSMSKAIDIVRTMKANLLDLFSYRLHSHVYSFDEVLAAAGKIHHDNPIWPRLPRWAHSEVGGYSGGLMDSIRRDQVWTHVLDGERLISKLDVDKIEGRHHEINTEESYFCFAYCFPTEGRTYLVPWRTEDRLEEIESGRLSENDLKMLKNNRKRLAVPRGNSPIVLYPLPIE